MEIDMTYAQYLRSFKWKILTQYFIDKYKCCKLCGSMNNLVVHHKKYSNYPFEEEADLVLVCSECHYKIHSQGMKIEERFFNEITTKPLRDSKDPFNLLELAKESVHFDEIFNENTKKEASEPKGL